MKAQRIIDIYAYLFARKKFARLNRFLFQLALRGLGILNYKNDVASGERHFLKQHLSGKTLPVVFDVGANVGDYSSAVLALNPKTRLFAFEPHPDTFVKLASNITSQGALLVNAACGKNPGEVVLYDYSAEGSELASVYQGVIEQLHGHKARARMVPVIDLDTFAIDHQIEHIDLLKVDTEGHELEVLAGARHLLETGAVEAIQFEFNEMNVISRTFFRDFYDILLHYDLYRMQRDGLTPLRDYSPVLCEIFAFQNIVALLRTQRPLSENGSVAT